MVRKLIEWAVKSPLIVIVDLDQGYRAVLSHSPRRYDFGPQRLTRMLDKRQAATSMEEIAHHLIRGA